jgi:polyferredoxin
MSDRIATMPGPDIVWAGRVRENGAAMDFMMLEWIGKPIWMWAGFIAIVLALLAFTATAYVLGLFIPAVATYPASLQISTAPWWGSPTTRASIGMR